MTIAKLFALHANEINNFQALNSISYIFPGYISFEILQKHTTYKQSIEENDAYYTGTECGIEKMSPLWLGRCFYFISTL